LLQARSVAEVHLFLQAYCHPRESGGLLGETLDSRLSAKLLGEIRPDGFRRFFGERGNDIFRVVQQTKAVRDISEAIIFNI